MKLYIDKELLEEVAIELGNYWFTSDVEEDSYNNDETIEISKRFDEAIKEAETNNWRDNNEAYARGFSRACKEIISRVEELNQR